MKKTAAPLPHRARTLLRAELYRAFSRAFRPPSAEPVDAGRLYALLSAHSPGRLPPPAWDAGQWARQHREIFGHGLSPDCPPYETFYGPAHIFRQAQELADISGFYAAWGLEVSGQAHERADHVSLELEFMAYLAVKEAHAADGGDEGKAALCRQSETKFLADHLGRWIPAFHRRLEAKATGSVYARLAGALDAFVRRDCQELGARPSVFQGFGDLRPQETAPGSLSCGGPEGTPPCDPCGGISGCAGNGADPSQEARG